jgi:hypothetical protein
MTSLSRTFWSLLESLRSHSTAWILFIVLVVALFGALMLIIRSSYVVRMCWKNGSLELSPSGHRTTSNLIGVRRINKRSSRR